MKTELSQLVNAIRLAVAMVACFVAGASYAEEVALPESSDGAVEIAIEEDSTLAVGSDVAYGSLAITGSGKLTLAGEGKITAGSVAISEGITLANCGQLNSSSVAVGANGVFEIAAPVTWTHAISGEGGVRVAADEVVFAAQSTFTGGLTVASGGRAKSNVGASLGGGGGGGFGGVPTWDAKINANRFYGNVKVEAGGAVDMIHNHYLSCYSLTLAGTGIDGTGAAYRSGGISDPENQPHAKSITLTDDATVCADYAWGLIAPSFGATTLDLADHTLTITGEDKFLLCNTTISGTGTIEIAGGATLKTVDNKTKSVRGNNTTCRIKSGGKLDINQTTTFGNIVCEAGGMIKFGANRTLNAEGSLEFSAEGSVTIDISGISDIAIGATNEIIKCSSVTAETDITSLRVVGKAGYRLKAIAGTGIVVEHVQDILAWSNGSWNVGIEDMQRYSAATIVLSEGTNEVAIADGLTLESVNVTANGVATLLFTGGTAEIGALELGENVTYVHTGVVTGGTVYVRTGAGIASESDTPVADALSLAMGTTIYRGAKTVDAQTISVSTGGGVPLSSLHLLGGNGNESTILVRNVSGEEPSGLWRVVGGRWSEPRPSSDVFIFEPELPQGAGDRVVADDGLYFARASLTSSTGSVTAHESAQDAVDAAAEKGGKVTVYSGGEVVELGAAWLSSGSGVAIILGTGVTAVTVTVGGVVISGTDSGDGSTSYDPKDGVARAEVVETGKKYASLALAKGAMGDEPCTFRLLADSGDPIHLASVGDASGQTLLLNNFHYTGAVTGAAASLERSSSVQAYYAVLAGAKNDWVEGDTINLLTDDARYAVQLGKTLVLDGERHYAVQKPFDLSGTLKVGGCTFTASAGIVINAGTLQAAKANCILIGSGNEVTLREGGVKVDTDGYTADIAAVINVAGGLATKPEILKAGLANLKLSGGVTGSAVITVPANCGKVVAPASSDCEPGYVTQISEQDADWATFENGIAVANLVKFDGTSVAYSSINAAGAAAQLNPTYRYIEVLVNNQTLRCLPTIGEVRVKYDNTVFTFQVKSIALDWEFDEVYAVAFSVFTPVHKATDYVWNGGEQGEWETFGNWKCNVALEYDLPVATRTPDGDDTVIFRTDGMPAEGWKVNIGSSGGECKEIKVEEGVTLALSYDSSGSDIAKSGPGAILVAKAWTSGTPAITVKEDGGTVTIPKSARYALGENTAVVAETDDTLTLGFAASSTGSYEAWAAENGITGAWNEKDESGIYNVFRYVFDKAKGEFTIIDISFDADGNVIITTAPVANTGGFAVSVVESTDVKGTDVTDERSMAASSNTAVFVKSPAPRFYRLHASRRE